MVFASRKLNVTKVSVSKTENTFRFLDCRVVWMESYSAALLRISHKYPKTWTQVHSLHLRKSVGLPKCSNFDISRILAVRFMLIRTAHDRLGGHQFPRRQGSQGRMWTGCFILDWRTRRPCSAVVLL